MPADRFHLILCRNLAFTYFETRCQERILDALLARLRTGGYLVIGAHEKQSGLQQWLPSFRGSSCIFGPKPHSPGDSG